MRREVFPSLSLSRSVCTRQNKGKDGEREGLVFNILIKNGESQHNKELD